MWIIDKIIHGFSNNTLHFLYLCHKQTLSRLPEISLMVEVLFRISQPSRLIVFGSCIITTNAILESFSNNIKKWTKIRNFWDNYLQNEHSIVLQQK